MKTSSTFAVILVFIVVSIGAVMARDDIVVKREAAERFATLPDGVQFPEGIAANPHNGDIYVATFDSRNPPSVRNNQLLRFGKNGHLIAQRSFGTIPVLGLEFNPADNKVYICNVGVFAGVASKIQRIAGNFTDTKDIEDVADIPLIGGPDPLLVDNPDGSQNTITFGSNRAPVPNALKFDRDGILFVSDSLQGAIFRIDHACGTPCNDVETVKHDGLLATV